jgi:5-deoxy-glucuronate isomerase
VSKALHLPTTGGEVEVLPADAGWSYSGLRVLDLAATASRTIETGDAEVVVLPLAGSCTVTCDGETFELRGRASVFSRVSDFAYVPRDASVTIASAAGGRFALASAVCSRRLPFRYGAAEDVPVETRGTGSCSRQVNNFAAAGVFECDKLIAVEVLTPAGNWSSYPPHKHDEDRPGEESVLEEIYYFEVRTGGSAPRVPPEDPRGRGIAFQRVYGTQDLLAEVRSGDVVTIPDGWHGPSMAAPGYDLYYLNVMAGPSDERSWLICDDPAHAWVRQTWADQEVDPRLPMTTTEEVSP